MGSSEWSLPAVEPTDFLSAVIQNFGLIVFTAIGLGLAVYLAYYMVRPQRF